MPIANVVVSLRGRNLPCGCLNSLILWFYESLQRGRSDGVLKLKFIVGPIFDKKAWAIGEGNCQILVRLKIVN